METALVRDITVQKDGQLLIDGLPLRAGDHIRVTIAENDPFTSDSKYPLHGKPIRYDHPFEPAINPADWEPGR